MRAVPEERLIALVRGLLTAVLTTAVLSLIWPQTLGGAVVYIGVDGHSMDGTYVDGDLIVTRRQASYVVGDIITYKIPAGEFGAGARVIHRITGGDGETGFVTQGDNRDIKDPWRPRTSDVVGKSWLRVPHGAAVFLWLARPVNLGALVAALTVLVMLLPRKERQVSVGCGSALPARR